MTTPPAAPPPSSFPPVLVLVPVLVSVLVGGVWLGWLPAGPPVEMLLVAAVAAPAAVAAAWHGSRPPAALLVTAAAIAAAFGWSQWVTPVGHPFPPFTMYTEPAPRGQVLTFTMVDVDGRPAGHVPFRDAGTVSGSSLTERFVQLTAAALDDPAAAAVLADALSAVIARRTPPAPVGSVDVAVCTATTTAPVPVCEPLLTVPLPAPGQPTRPAAAPAAAGEGAG